VDCWSAYVNVDCVKKLDGKGYIRQKNGDYNNNNNNQALSRDKHLLTFRVWRCCHSNETHALIANPPNSAQPAGTPTSPPTYIQVHAAVWACGRGQTHRRVWPLYILHCLWLMWNVTTHLTSQCTLDDPSQLVPEKHRLTHTLSLWLLYNIFRRTGWWRGYLSGARCKWFAYSPADATATLSSLAPVKSRMVYLSGASLLRLSWKKAVKWV